MGRMQQFLKHRKIFKGWADYLTTAVARQRGVRVYFSRNELRVSTSAGIVNYENLKRTFGFDIHFKVQQGTYMLNR